MYVCKSRFKIVVYLMRRWVNYLEILSLFNLKISSSSSSDMNAATASDHKDLFLLAMDCLNHRSKPEILDRGLQLAVTHAEFVRGTIQQCVDLGQIVNSGPFLYAQVGLIY